MRLPNVILCIMLIAVAGSSAVARTGSQEPGASLSILNIGGLPVYVSEARFENLTVNSWVEIEVRNSLSECVREMSFRIVRYDAKGNLSGLEDGVIADALPVGLSRSRALIGNVLDRTGHNFLLLTKIRTNSGVWFVKPDALNRVLKQEKFERTNLQVEVTYEPNMTLTTKDKGKILHLALSAIVRDPSKPQLIANHRPILLLKEGCDFSLQLKSAVAEVRSLDEIQTIADKEQQVVFTRCTTFEVEGLKVKIHLVFNDRVARGLDHISIPFKFNYEFILTKHNNQWTLQKMFGYS